MTNAGGRPTEDELFKAFLAKAEAAGWTFDVRETSANVYLIEGSDRRGRTVSRHGHDLLRMFADLEVDMAGAGRPTR